MTQTGGGQTLQERCINTIRFLAADAVQKANSGHPGMPMGAAAMAFALWTRHLRHDPAGPTWPDRDRFVLSAGHGSMLLYSLLHLTGYQITRDDLKAFRQLDSITPGHPERGLTPGVETTTGPLGQGIATAVGMAIAEAHLAAMYNGAGHDIVDHHTYVIAGDGDMMEGVSSEAASWAGHLGLGKLIVLYDDNHISIDGSTELAFTEDVAARFAAYGWHVQKVADGNDVDAVDRAIAAAKAEIGRPSILCVRTHIGFGAPTRQDTAKAHGEPLGVEELRAAKENLGWPLEPDFLVPDDVLAFFRGAVAAGAATHADWNGRVATWRAAEPDLATQWERALARQLPGGWDAELPVFKPEDGGLATRAASGKTINAVAGSLPELCGGSADLTPSNNTFIDGGGEFSPTDRAGRYLHFGVREHAMAAAGNGMALHGGLRPFCGTFFCFVDYMRPALRIAALTGAPVIHVLTHDSIGLGEDGPTHQPIEHLALLRATPGWTVIRPADANETVLAWKMALRHHDGPVGLVLTRQKLPTMDRARFAPAAGIEYGGYVLADWSWTDLGAGGPAGAGAAGGPAGAGAASVAGEGSESGALREAGPAGSGAAVVAPREAGPAGSGAAVVAPREAGATPTAAEPPQIVLIATGSEVQHVLGAWERLVGEGVRARVVNLASWEVFGRQDQSYRDAVLPPAVTCRLAVEAAATFGWERWVGLRGEVIGLDRFGASAPAEQLFDRFGFTAENVYQRALVLLVRGGD